MLGIFGKGKESHYNCKCLLIGQCISDWPESVVVVSRHKCRCNKNRAHKMLCKDRIVATSMSVLKVID